MNRQLIAAGVAALVLVAAVGGAFVAGDHYRNNAWLAKQATAERTAKKDYEAEVARGNKATTDLVTAQRQHAANYKKFERQFNDLRQRSPLVAFSGGGSDCGAGPSPSTLPLPAPGQAGADGLRAAGAPSLTAGAVWMWNTALAGTDQPLGACGAASTTTTACAAATPLTLNDAWDNHSTNAEICAANRLAHQQLIDFLTRPNKQSESIKP